MIIWMTRSEYEAYSEPSPCPLCDMNVPIQEVALFSDRDPNTLRLIGAKIRHIEPSGIGMEQYLRRIADIIEHGRS